MTIILKDMDIEGFKVMLRWFSKIDPKKQDEFLEKLHTILHEEP